MAWYSEQLPYDSIERQRCIGSPRFWPGDLVQTIVGSVGDYVVKTELVAFVARYSYHWKLQTWMYRLALPGRRKKHDYLECQLKISHETTS